jgi:hypothetical protein
MKMKTFASIIFDDWLVFANLTQTVGKPSAVGESCLP